MPISRSSCAFHGTGLSFPSEPDGNLWPDDVSILLVHAEVGTSGP